MEHILVVDDDSDILDALQFVLEDSGYSVKITEEGEEAEKLLTADNLPRLIILDVLLSGMDGRDIVKKLKTNKRTSKIPIIMISAHPTAKKSVLEAGANSFLPKPFDVDELLQTIKHALRVS